MAGSALASFTVGVQYDMDQRSERRVAASFDRVKKGALAIGAALVGAGAALTAQANTIDEMGAFARAMNIPIEQLNAMQMAFEKNSSSAEEMRSVMKQLDEARLSLLRGDGDFFGDWALGDIPAFLTEIADPIQRMIAMGRWVQGAGAGSDREKQMASIMGFSATQLEALRSNLPATYADQLTKSNLRGSDLDDSREWLGQMHEFGTAMDNLGLAVGRVLDGPLGTLLEMMTRAANFGADVIDDGGPSWWRELQGQFKYQGGGGTGARNPQSSAIPIRLEMNGEVFARGVLGIEELRNQQQSLNYGAVG